jgi:peptidoglycan/xylan/chitin deacetylase (PgdA/CDA1 family)
MAKKIQVSVGIDVDAVGGWLGSYGGEDSPGDISRGIFAGEVGVPRLLKLAQDREMPVTWFWPGHSIETFPEQFEATVAAGHEVGVHGYSHENPIAMSREQETEVLDYCIDLFTTRTGKKPVGYVAPWWEFSNVTNEILLERGFLYDHSLMHNDFSPYYVRVGDSWTKINYDAASAREWMKPLVRGEETDLIEIPANWYLDDLPPMMFIKGSANSHGFVSPRDIEQMWKDHPPGRFRPPAEPADARAPVRPHRRPRRCGVRQHGDHCPRLRRPQPPLLNPHKKIPLVQDRTPT